MSEADLRAGGGEPAAAALRDFPCRGCGAKLAFAPGTSTLKCPYCGTQNEVAARPGAPFEEKDFEAALHALEGAAETLDEAHVKCGKCGAEQTLGGSLFAGKCAFCGTAIVSEGYAHRRIKPTAMVPFQVQRAQAQESFRKWLRRLWLAPGDLRRYAESDTGIAGLYLPFWTYDCRTESDYRGQRGDDYNTTESYTTRNASGETVSGTRNVRQTRWTPVSGHVSRFHNDVLVMASRTLPDDIVDATARWNLTALVPYQLDYVSGFQAEAYAIGLREGFPIARRTIDAQVEWRVKNEIGGDHQRVDAIRTTYNDITYKHVLLPVWISAYRYRDKVYRFLVNGQTGEVSGESPKSAWKIALLVAAVLLLLFLALYLGSK